MKINPFDSESFLLVTGDLLIAGGGIALGLYFAGSIYANFLIYFSVILIGLGAYFDCLSIRGFSTKLNKLKDQVKKASDQLEDTMKKVKEATDNLKETNKALYGNENGTFSTIKWYNSVEHQFKDLKNEIQKLKDKIQEINYRNSQQHRRY